MGAPLTIATANLGMADTLILMVLALVVFGPRRLPQIGRQIGKLMYEFRKASNDFKYQMEEELRTAEEAERRKKEEAQRAQALNAPAVAVSADPAVAAPVVNAIEQSGSSTDTAATETAATETASTDAVSIPAPTVEVTTAADVVVSGPKIQPPSTGEPVMASRPGARVEAEPEAPAAEGEMAASAANASATEATQTHG
ncbi:MAG: twin-arginine translocase TatA/TatE family subunit [Terracidiphilus sp.]